MMTKAFFPFRLIPFSIVLGILVTPAAFAQYSHSNLSRLTLVERQELEQTCREAARIPAVKSTRRIARMELHNAMLKADPTIDTIFANMNAHAPKSHLTISDHKKHFGMQFSSWLANYPPESVAALTAAERQKLEAAHQKGLQDAKVILARKTARITFYNAIVNIDPKMISILTQAGITMPSNIRRLAIRSKNLSSKSSQAANNCVASVLAPSSRNDTLRRCVPLTPCSSPPSATLKTGSKIGSEEQILGGDDDLWDSEILAPAIESNNVNGKYISHE